MTAPINDPLGKAVREGRDSATYLWQVPDDEPTLGRMRELLHVIKLQSGAQGRTEMPSLCDELLETLDGPPGPQQADMLQAGFDRLDQLWGLAKSINMKALD